MNKPTKEELIMLDELMYKASHHFNEVIKQQRKESGGSQLAIDLLDLACKSPEEARKLTQEMCANWVLENWDELIKETQLL